MCVMSVENVRRSGLNSNRQNTLCPCGQFFFVIVFCGVCRFVAAAHVVSKVLSQQHDTVCVWSTPFGRKSCTLECTLRAARIRSGQCDHVRCGLVVLIVCFMCTLYTLLHTRLTPLAPRTLSSPFRFDGRISGAELYVLWWRTYAGSAILPATGPTRHHIDTFKLVVRMCAARFIKSFCARGLYTKPMHDSICISKFLNIFHYYDSSAQHNLRDW